MNHKLFFKQFIILIFGFIANFAFAQENTSFINASVDNTVPFVGQPILYTWQLYRPVGETTENAQFFLPSFSSFGQEEMPTGEPELQTIKGQSMQVVQRQIALYPLQRGTFTIDPLRITLPETPFQPQTTLEAPAVTITVSPLPANAAASFQNALGQFDVVAALNTTSIAVGEPVILSLTITGTGNIQQISRPKINLPELWRIFEHNSTLEIKSPLFGSQRFDWQIIASQSGIHVIPALEFSFLNPQTGLYETRATTPMPIEVLQGNNTLTQQPTPQNTGQTAHVPMPLKSLPENLSPTKPGINIVTLLAWLLPPLIAGIVALKIFLAAHPKSTPQNKVPPKISGSRALKDAQIRLKTALTQPPKEASITISTIILMYLSRKSGQNVQRETMKNAIAAVHPDLQTDLQKKVLACLDHADAGRYAPVSEQDIQLLVRDTLRVLVEIDKTWQS